MAITNIENYLKPLSNNERAVLLYAANVRNSYWHWRRVERTTSLHEDLTGYARKRTKMPDVQVENAIESLEAKGYIRLEPKRGNYTFKTRNYWNYWSPHNGTMATNASIFRGKTLFDLHHHVPWTEIAEIIPVEDVKQAIVDYREEKDRNEKREQVTAGERVLLRQREIETRLLRLCENYVKNYAEGGTITENPDEQYRDYMPYTCADIVSAISDAAKELDRWTYKRRDIERTAATAKALLEQEVAA